jgi:O-antigen ligase
MTATWVYSILHQRILFYLCCLLMVAFFISQALISIAIIAIILDGLIILFSERKSEKFKPCLLTWCLFGFGITLITGWLLSENKHIATDVLLNKLPFLLFPLIVIALKQLPQRLLVQIAALYSYMCYFTAAVSVFVYFRNKEYFDILILQAKSIPVSFGYGVFHIQFSILLALSILFGLWLVWKPMRSAAWYFKLFLISVTILNFFFMHVLAARTGLIAIYLILIFVVIGVLFKNYPKKAIYITLFLALLIAAIFQFSDSLKNRLANTREDLKVVMTLDNPNEQSLATRIEAWRISLILLKGNPITGIGLGDVESKMWVKYPEANTRLQPRNYKKPHNQFLETALQGGVFALIFLTLILFVYYRNNKRFLLVKSFLFLFIFSFIFESMLERQVSTVGFGFFLAFVQSLSQRTE